MDANDHVETLENMLDDPHWVKQLEDKWRERAYISDDSPHPVQNVPTPPKLCQEIVNKLKEFTSLKGKRVLTLNVEFLSELLDADEVVFLADNKNKAVFAKTFYPKTRIVEGYFLDWETDMEFNVIVGNPPFQASQNREKTGRGRSGSTLWDKVCASFF